jgi:predicted aconitase with swiveling domain
MERGTQMNRVLLKGRTMHGGIAEGEAVVTKEGLGGMSVFDMNTGTVIEIGNDINGQNVRGKILVFKCGKGSSSWALWHQMLRFMGVSPKAYIVKESNPQTALGAAVLRCPFITELDEDPTQIISTGDWVKVDGDKGVVEIVKKLSI